MYCSVWCLGWTLMLGRYFWHSYLVKIYNVGINGEFSPVLQVLALQAIFKEGIELVNQLLYHETCLTHSSACLLCVSSGGGTRWHSWLRHCATSRKVTGSIPYGVNGIFHWHNPSGRTMTLGLTQPLIEMSTRNISWGVKAAGALGWQPYHFHVLIVLKSGSLKLLESSGPVQTCNGIALPLPLPYSDRSRPFSTFHVLRLSSSTLTGSYSSDDVMTAKCVYNKPEQCQLKCKP